MILIFYALRRELGGVRGRIANRSVLGGGLRGFKGRIGSDDVTLVSTGIGVEQARASARRALQTLPQPRMVISTGVAGGLVPELRAGDLVIADRFLMESGVDAFESVHVASEPVHLARSALHRAGLTAAAGPMLTARLVLASAADKREAYTRCGAVAVDMESAAIAIEAAGRGVPFVCVRAIIDEAGDEIPGAGLADEAGQVSMLKAAAYFMKNPSALTRVPAILKNMGRATAAIASALEALCSDRGE